MSVHLQIADQVKNHRNAQKLFLELDAKREHAIAALLEQAKKGDDITVQSVNSITEEMNQLAKRFQFPPRKLVTKEMVLEFIQKDS